MRLFILIVLAIGFASFVYAGSAPACAVGMAEVPSTYYKGGVLTPTEPVSKSASIELYFLAHPNHAPAQTCA